MTDNFGEERQQLHQRIAMAEIRAERMERAHTDGGLNQIALDVALSIEDLFAQHHAGGRTQRLARMQIVIREAMRANLKGETHWQYPNSVRNASKPEGQRP